MSLKKLFQTKHLRILTFSLVTLACSLGLSLYWIYGINRSPALSSAIEEPIKYCTKHIAKQDFPVKFAAFGTAQAGCEVTYRAPMSGKVVYLNDLYPGQTLETGALLITLDKSKLEHRLSITESEKRQLLLNIEENVTALQNIEKKLKSANSLYQIALETVQKYEKQLDLELQLYTKIEQLHQEQVLSQNEFLRKQGIITNAELALLQSKTQAENAKQIINELEQEEQRLKIYARSFVEKQHKLQEESADISDDLKKCELHAEFPMRVVSVNVHEEEEVTPGAELFTLRRMDYTEVSVNLPDTYFPWLYQGNLLSNKHKLVLDIELVNSEMHKLFANGYIQSIGERVQNDTRSLPILIRRDNPSNENGDILLHEELLPGMFCKINLDLCNLNNVYIIPRHCLHNGSEIYIADNSSLHIISDVQILFNDGGSYVVNIPENLDTFTIIADPVSHPKEGMHVDIFEEVS